MKQKSAEGGEEKGRVGKREGSRKESKVKQSEIR